MEWVCNFESVTKSKAYGTKKGHNDRYYQNLNSEVRNGVEYFHFNRADIYMNPSLDKFLNLLREGKIMYDIRIGSYKSGAKRGKPHDHGSGFRILEGDIRLLYDIHEVVE